MNPLDNIILNSLLRVEVNGSLYQKEDIQVEYKQIFDRHSKDAKAKYAKELAAMFNCEGGYLIFGVEDNTAEVIGLPDFIQPDNADLSNDVNTYFSPSVPFISRIFNTNGKTLFIIYVEKRKSIPTVCIKSHQDVLKDGTIYWRYSGKSSPIESGDLINLLLSLRGEENKRLADISEKELKAKYKPYIQAHGSMSSGGNITIGIINNGERAKLRDIKVIEGDIIPPIPYTKLPVILTKNLAIKIPINSLSGDRAMNLNYKLEFIFDDEIGTRYSAIVEYYGAAGKIADPVEIS